MLAYGSGLEQVLASGFVESQQDRQVDSELEAE
jgi:hypothetical protein